MRRPIYASVGAPVSGGIFEFGQHLSGMSQFLMDLLEDKPFANRMLDRIVAVHAELWKISWMPWSCTLRWFSWPTILVLSGA